MLITSNVVLHSSSLSVLHNCSHTHPIYNFLQPSSPYHSPTPFPVTLLDVTSGILLLLVEEATGTQLVATANTVRTATAHITWLRPILVRFPVYRTTSYSMYSYQYLVILTEIVGVIRDMTAVQSIPQALVGSYIRCRWVCTFAVTCCGLVLL